MTKKIYDYKSNEFEFEAIVEKCEKNDKGNFEIVLDKTAFFPGGGGQEADTGEINSNKLIDIYEKNNEIYHVLSCGFSVGEKVKGKLNGEKRLKNMQSHSAEHIVSGIIHNLYGYENVGFHMGSDCVTMDVDGRLHDEDLKKIEMLSNEAIWKNIAFKVYYPNPQELSKIEYRSKLDLKENVRIVEIEGYDKCACCAPHVEYSGQIGVIKLLDLAYINNKTRIRMLGGHYAVKDYFEKSQCVHKISVLLSANKNDVYKSVEKLYNDFENKKYEYVGLKRQLFDIKYKNIVNDKNIIVFEENCDMNELIYILNLLKENNSGICGVFCGDDIKGYNYAVGSNTVDINDVKEEFLKSLNAKGGGTSQLIQGFCKTYKKNIDNFFLK